jgi:RNA polymerase sigma factor (TIGR02999 family)
MSTIPDPPAPGPALPSPPAGEVTQWLAQVGGSGPAVNNRLFELLYDELQRLARLHMRREDPGHTLSPAGLVHEAWFRMAEQTRTRWHNRQHFMSVASTMMRRILVDHQSAHATAKRSAERVPLTLAGVDALGQAPQHHVVAVHDALLAFEAIDPRAARVVEMRFFGGLALEEIADALGVSLVTVKRDWAAARAWLLRELAGRA